MRKSLVWRIVVTAVVLVIGAFSVTSVTEKWVDGPLLGDLSRKTDGYLNDTMFKAGASYGVLRVGNAIVSIIQDTELTVPGLSIAFGEVLDPINDILERTSTVMMFSLTSIGIQKIIIKVGSWVSLTVLFSVAMLAALVGIWFPDSAMRAGFRQWAAKILIIALLVYFFVPFAYFANQKVYDLFMEDTYQASMANVEDFNENLKQFQKNKDDVENGFWDRFDLKARFQRLKQKLGALEERATELIADLINLAVVFIVQTVLIPLLFLWLLIKLVGAVVRSGDPGHFVWDYTGRVSLRLREAMRGGAQ